MNFDLNKSIELLERTPLVFEGLFKNNLYKIDQINEGENTWNAKNIIGHLIYGEMTDWIPRAETILDKEQKNKTFQPYDRFAQDKLFNKQSINQLLSEFKQLRLKNIEILKSWNLNENKLQLTGIHPELGIVTLKELISTWTIHDLVHINQISRVLVKHYTNDIGPWINYINFLKQ